MPRHDSAPPELTLPHVNFRAADIRLCDLSDEAAGNRLGNLVLEKINLMSFRDESDGTFHDS
jgi:hypothetical protein